jgi:NADPH-dependent 2,4-dienoyl-CoA reductase/sulfur reductase-like enzyme
MPPPKIVVVGGDAAGMSAASKARRTNPDATVIVLEKGDYVSYSACGLPYWIEGVVADADDLISRTADEHRNAGIDLRIRHEAVALDTRARTLSVHALESDYTQPFDKLILATGARPKLPPFVTGTLEGVFTLKTIPDATRIREYLSRFHVDRAVVVGGGYIGVEMSEALTVRGVGVTLLEHGSQILKLLDADVASKIAGYMSRQGVEIRTNADVRRLLGSNRVEGVELSDGERLRADMVIVSAGVTPNAELASKAGIATAESGAIAVDPAQRTSAFHVYAAGDCAEARHLVLDRNVYIPLGTTANKQGRVAGENAAGGRATFGGVVGTTVCKVFDRGFARTGLTDEQARRYGFVPQSATVEAHSRAGYYKRPPSLDVKLTFDARTRRLLGAQLFGDDTVAKRIDIVVTALTARMTVDAFAQLDLSYAPPYSPVWDPLLVAANVAAR